jgi:hypothetical protein
MNVTYAKGKRQTKKKGSTTSTQLLKNQKASKDGMNTPCAYSWDEKAGKFCVVGVIQTKPPESEKSESDIGKKYDDLKPTLAYIPKIALYTEGDAFKYGAKKYNAWNYKNGISVTRTLSAALRHIYEFLDGENYDKESGAHHLGSARANIAMALDTLFKHPEMDDRYKE